MAEWREGNAGTRFKVEDNLYIVSYPDKPAADAGIEVNTGVHGHKVLEVVDQMLADLGPEAVGLPRAANRHVSHNDSRPGAVTLWHPFTPADDAEEEGGEEGWVPDTVRRYAACLAKQVAAWLKHPFELTQEKRPLRPEDILILVRRRGELAALIVARLHAEGVPVAPLPLPIVPPEQKN